MTRILHIVRKTEWEAAQRDGVYRPPSLEKEGFIHFSQSQQVLMVANAFYAGQSDLVIVEVDSDLLRASLRWEPPDGPPLSLNQTEASAQRRFPHLYGPLNLDAVVAVHEFPLETDNHFILPPGLTPGG
jgi:uncharacterized protein (DUF952 family)